MKRILHLAIIFVFQIPWLFSQSNPDYSKFTGEPVKMSITLRMVEPFYMVYDSAFQIGKISDQTTLNTSTPENLLKSIYNAKAKKDLYNLYTFTSDVSEDIIKRRSKADTATNYFVLIHKLTFNHQGKETAIVKYYEVEDGKKRPINAIQSQKQGNNWIAIQDISIKDIEFVIKTLTSEAFRVLNIGRKTEDPTINDLIEKTREQFRVMNITKVALILREWLSNNDKEKLAKVSDIKF